MTKSFKSSNLHNRELEVDTLFGNPRLIIKDFDGDNKGFTYEKADAPELALEVLEKAGFKEDTDPMNHFELAMYHLMEGIKAQERAKAEAKDKAELKAEALELVNAWREAGNCTPLTDWGTLIGTSVGDYWLAVARKAREIGGRAEK